MRLGVGALLLCAVVSACAGPLDRGERLYRLGDVRGALETWSGIPGDHPDRERAEARLRIVGDEFDRMLRRYEKKAAFFEEGGQLAEAILYYRLALKLAPDRRHLLDRVQVLARDLDAAVERERAGLAAALGGGRLAEAQRHATQLSRLDPFDPAIQNEIRAVQSTAGGEVRRLLDEGERAYRASDYEAATGSFQSVLALDPDNEVAKGHLAYIERFRSMDARRELPPPPRTISESQIRAEGHYGSGRQAEQNGDPFRAIEEYLAALRLQSEHVGARVRLEQLRRGLSPQVEDLYEAGKRYFQDEDLHNALRIWRRVLLIDPNHARTQENVARAERILSRLEEIQTRGS